MPVSGKVLEDSIRLSRIRRIKLTLYAVQAVMLVALGFLVIFAMGGARMTPSLYVPVDSFIVVMVLLLLIICLESFFFRILEIRFARSSSARHLMAKNSIKRAILIAIVTGGLAIVLTFQPVLGGLESAASDTVIVSPGVVPPDFYSSDIFALSRVFEVEVTAPEVIQVYLLDDEIYQSNRDNLSALYTFRLNKANYVVDSTGITIDVPQGGYTRYHLVLNDMDNPGTSATAIIQKSASPIFTGLGSLLMISFAVANGAWAAYLMPIERKYSVGSIYR